MIRQQNKYCDISKTSMRILYLHQYFNTPEMNGGTRSFEMARRLVAAGHEVHMVTSNRNAHMKKGWSLIKESGINVHWISIPYSNSMSYQKRIKAFVQFAFHASLYAARISADIVFATSTPLTIAIPGIIASFFKKKPMVLEVRDLWPQLPIAVGAIRNPLNIFAAKLLERLAYHAAAAIVALSPGMKTGVLRTGYPPQKVHVIPNSCDRDLFQVDLSKGRAFRNRFKWLGERPLVIYAGTIGYINGVDYLARLAAETIKYEPEIRFLTVGDGREFDKVKHTAAKLGILNTTFFMIHGLPKKAMPALFSAATLSTSLFVDLPEMWANSANKFFDSLAAGRPIAINYKGWQADLLKKTSAGLVLPPNDIALAARMVIKAVKDEQWLKSARKSALTLAKNSFDRDCLAADLTTVLSRVAGLRS